MAQNVYSLNVVGYINLSFTNGYNLIANQLDVDGTLTNNTLSTVFPTNLPNLTKVSVFNPATASFNSSTWSASGLKWSGTAAAQALVNAGLAPGAGAFVFIPAAATLPQGITLVGNVVQGTHVLPIQLGLQNVSFVAPISGGIQTVLGYSPTKLDKVQQFSPASQSYVSRTWSGTAWSGGVEPTLAVGESVFINSKAATNWSQTFTVQ